MIIETPAMEPWVRRPIYKFGMLFAIAILAGFHFWRLAGDSTRDASKTGLVVLMMLAVNHGTLAFLEPAQQRRAIPLQVTVLVGALAYVVVTYWKELSAS